MFLLKALRIAPRAIGGTLFSVGLPIGREILFNWVMGLTVLFQRVFSASPGAPIKHSIGMLTRDGLLGRLARQGDPTRARNQCYLAVTH